MLLDRWLPKFDVSKRHAIEIAAPPERIWDEVLHYDFSRSAVTRILMTLRGYGGRPSGGGGTLSDRLQRFGFTLLEESPGEELVFGLVGKFWQADGGLRQVTAAEFSSFVEPGFAKAAWNLLLTDRGLVTETRVLCLGESARRKFLLYWRTIEPFSALIRRSLLRAVRRAASR